MVAPWRFECFCATVNREKIAGWQKWRTGIVGGRFEAFCLQDRHTFRKKLGTGSMDHPIVVTVVGGAILAALTALGTWLWRRFVRPEIRLSATTEAGPASRELGFTEPAVKITVSNVGSSPVVIKDVRLMFCRGFGAAVAADAPSGRAHPKLPVSLEAGTDEIWYVPAEKLSGLLCGLRRPERGGSPRSQVKLDVRCVAGNRVHQGARILFPTDPGAHWP